MGITYVSSETWVIAQTWDSFAGGGGTAAQLGQIYRICAANDEVFVKIVFFPSIIIDQAWDTAGRLVVNSALVMEDFTTGTAYSYIHPIQTLALTPLKLVGREEQMLMMMPVR